MIEAILILFLISVNLWLRVKLRRCVAPWFLKVIFTLGVPIHEAAHYIFAQLLCLKVTKAKFLPDFKDTSRMGYVEFIPHRGLVGAITSMLVGLAPLLFGCGILYLLHTLDNSSVMNGFFQDIGVGIVSVIIIQSMIPSTADLKIAKNGLVLVILGLWMAHYCWGEANLRAYFNTSVLDVASPYLIVLTAYQLIAIVIFKIFTNKIHS